MSMIKSGDTVVVLTGSVKKDNTGKLITHKVTAVSPDEGKVIVENVNKVHKHVKPRKQGEQGGIVDTDGAIYLSKIAIYCPDCKKGVRIKAGTDDKGNKIRKCAKCGKVL
jgi:large subunit ribosomal protein L24